MRIVYGWDDYRQSDFRINGQFARNLRKNDDILTIVSGGGISEIEHGFDEVLSHNEIETIPNIYEKIVIITDHDDSDTDEFDISMLQEALKKRNINNTIYLNEWNIVNITNQMGDKQQTRILPILIPYTEEGALETFLLSAISDEDEYDRRIIQEGNSFVDVADPEARYLTKRRWITKSKFRVFFSIRTAEEQYIERSNIYKSFPWEKYVKIHRELEILGEI